jgi:hypothetical protein
MINYLATPVEAEVPKAYAPEFPYKVLDLVTAGRPVAQAAHDQELLAAASGSCGVSEQSPSGDTQPPAPRLTCPQFNAPVKASARTSGRSTSGSLVANDGGRPGFESATTLFCG